MHDALYLICYCYVCDVNCRRQWRSHDGTMHADRQIIIELSPCMPRVQAAFTIEMGGVRGVGITTASTTITNAIHGVIQQQQQQQHSKAAVAAADGSSSSNSAV
jgi:hypothetical protein